MGCNEKIIPCPKLRNKVFLIKNRLEIFINEK